MTFTQRSSISSYTKAIHPRMTLRLEISVSGVYLDEHMQSIGNNENPCSNTVNLHISL